MHRQLEPSDPSPCRPVCLPFLLVFTCRAPPGRADMCGSHRMGIEKKERQGAFLLCIDLICHRHTARLPLLRTVSLLVLWPVAVLRFGRSRSNSKGLDTFDATFSQFHLRYLTVGRPEVGSGCPDPKVILGIGPLSYKNKYLQKLE